MKHADKILRAETVNGVFVGDPLSFSNTSMTLIEDEMRCISLHRVPSLDELLSSQEIQPDALRMIVVDERMLADLTQTLPKLRAAYPTACIALAYRRPETARRLLSDLQSNPSWGKIGFLPMNTNLDCWLSIVRLLATGECYVPIELFAGLPPAAAMQSEGETADDIHLTERELQVLASAAAGKQNKIIADDLKLSQHTVKLHMHHIIAKLGVKNRTEAANWFHRRKPTNINGGTK